MTQDERHLDLLAIFHYVVGGITAFFSCFPVFHLAFGVVILCGGFEGKAMEGNQPPPAFLGWFFILFAGAFILTGWTLAVLIFVAGHKLKRRVSYTYCVIVAGVECLLMPYGTVLGVFTILVLMKESVKSLFGLAKG